MIGTAIIVGVILLIISGFVITFLTDTPSALISVILLAVWLGSVAWTTIGPYGQERKREDRREHSEYKEKKKAETYCREYCKNVYGCPSCELIGRRCHKKQGNKFIEVDRENCKEQYQNSLYTIIDNKCYCLSKKSAFLVKGKYINREKEARKWVEKNKRKNGN